jgi:hypothetical protein
VPSSDERWKALHQGPPEWFAHHVRIGDGQTAVYAFHDSRDLGEKHLRMVAKDFGLTMEELKRLL